MNRTFYAALLSFILIALSFPAWAATDYSAYFVDIDVNNDEYITRIEFTTFFQNNSSPEIFDEIDTNADSYIDYDEWYVFKKNHDFGNRPRYGKSYIDKYGHSYIFVSGHWYKVMRGRRHRLNHGYRYYDPYGYSHVYLNGYWYKSGHDYWYKRWPRYGFRQGYRNRIERHRRVVRPFASHTFRKYNNPVIRYPYRFPNHMVGKRHLRWQRNRHLTIPQFYSFGGLQRQHFSQQKRHRMLNNKRAFVGNREYKQRSLHKKGFRNPQKYQKAWRNRGHKYWGHGNKCVKC